MSWLAQDYIRLSHCLNDRCVRDLRTDAWGTPRSRPIATLIKATLAYESIGRWRTSALARMTDSSRTIARGPKVPLAEVALIRSTRRDRATTWLRWSFGQPGSPQSFFKSREVFGMPIRANHVFETGNT